jgi:hypothetical protein
MPQILGGAPPPTAPAPRGSAPRGRDSHRTAARTAARQVVDHPSGRGPDCPRSRNSGGAQGPASEGACRSSGRPWPSFDHCGRIAQPGSGTADPRAGWRRRRGGVRKGWMPRTRRHVRGERRVGGAWRPRVLPAGRDWSEPPWLQGDSSVKRGFAGVVASGVSWKNWETFGSGPTSVGFSKSLVTGDRRPRRGAFQGLKSRRNTGVTHGTRPGNQHLSGGVVV